MDQARLNNTQKATRLFSIMLALTCFEHGLFEVMQGFNKTSGLVFQAIGSSIRWWDGGTEEALSIVPNYALTGFFTIAISVVIAVFATKYIRHRQAPVILLGLFLAATLFGGGIGHIPFFLTVYLYSQFNWRRQRTEARNSPVSLKITSWGAFFFWILAIEIAIFGYFPGTNDTDTLYLICWSSLGVTFFLMNVTYIAAVIADKKTEAAAS